MYQASSNCAKWPSTVASCPQRALPAVIVPSCAPPLGSRNLGQERRRDGAYAWDVFEDAAEKGRFLETFMVASWLEHLRQHQRITNADRVVQDAIRQFDAAAEPKVTHFIAATPFSSRVSAE